MPSIKSIRSMLSLLVLSFIGLNIPCCSALAAEIKLAWDPNPADQQVTEYAVYQDGAEVGRTAATTHTLALEPGLYVFYVTARNLWGESAPSNQVSTPAKASAPAGVTVTVPPGATVTVEVR